MTSTVKCEVIRDAAGVVTAVILTQRGRRLKVTYSRDSGFKLMGNLTKDFRDLLAATSIFGPSAIDITAQSLGNLDVDITAQTVGNLDIDIAAQSLGNLAIDIAAQTVDLDIKTSGGTNIIIDQLEQGAYTERRDGLTNEGAVVDYIAVTGNNRRGKFFPRGCRGFINSISCYCRDNGVAGGTITVYLAPFPGMGYIAAYTITVAAGGAAADRIATVYRYWPYDSMFIWYLSSTADMQVARDAGTPYDAYNSTDAGVTWEVANYRYHFTVNHCGETVGDLPVSGIINNVQIPNTSAAQQYTTLNPAASSEALATLIHGSGNTIAVIFFALSDNDRDDLRPRIYCDGNLVLPLDTEFQWWATNVFDYTTGGSPGVGIALTNFDTVNNKYCLTVTLKYPFKHSLQVGFYNSNAGNARTGYVATSYELIS